MMALPLVSATYTSVDGPQNTSPLTAANPTHVSGDILFAVAFSTCTNAAGTPTHSETSASGWNLMGSVASSGTGQHGRITAWWKRATSAGETNASVTCTPTGATSHHYMLVFRAEGAVTTGNPYENFYTNINNNAATVNSQACGGGGSDRRGIQIICYANDTPTGAPTETTGYTFNTLSSSDSNVGSDGYFNGRYTSAAVTDNNAFTWTWPSGGTVDDSLVVAWAIPPPGATTHDLTGAPALSLGVTGTITKRHALSGAPALSMGVTGTLNKLISLTGAPALSLGVTGTLSRQANLSGAPALSLGVTGTLTKRHDLTGAPALALGVTGTLVRVGPTHDLSGAPALSLGVSGALQHLYDLAGTPALALGVTGTLTKDEVWSKPTDLVTVPGRFARPRWNPERSHIWHPRAIGNASTLRDGFIQRKVFHVGHGWGPPPWTDSQTVAETQYNSFALPGTQGSVWTGAGTYDWTNPDFGMNYVDTHPGWSAKSAQLMYGIFLGQGNNTLVPAWLRGADSPTAYGTPTVTASQLSQHIHDWLDAYIGRFGTKLYTYEIGNELILDQTQGDADFYYDNSSIGAAGGKTRAEYVDQLMRWAKAANPLINVHYNEVYWDDAGNYPTHASNFNTFYNSLKSLNTPIDGFGTQCHLFTSMSYNFPAREDRYEAIRNDGYELHITEAGVETQVDAQGDTLNDAERIKQADYYRWLVRAFLGGAGYKAKAFTTWGTIDRIDGFDAGGMLFSTTGTKKPAFYYIFQETNSIFATDPVQPLPVLPTSFMRPKWNAPKGNIWRPALVPAGVHSLSGTVLLSLGVSGGLLLQGQGGGRSAWDYTGCGIGMQRRAIISGSHVPVNASVDFVNTAQSSYIVNVDVPLPATSLTAGNVIVVAIASNDTTHDSVTDTIGNTYEKVMEVTAPNVNWSRISIWAAKSTGTNASNIVTGHIGAAYGALIASIQLSGAQGWSLMQSAYGKATAATSVNTNFFTPLEGGMAAVAFAFAVSGGQTWAAGTNFTERTPDGGSSAIETRFNAPVSSQSAGFTYGTTDNADIVLALVRPNTTEASVVGGGLVRRWWPYVETWASGEPAGAPLLLTGSPAIMLGVSGSLYAIRSLTGTPALVLGLSGVLQPVRNLAGAPGLTLGLSGVITRVGLAVSLAVPTSVRVNEPFGALVTISNLTSKVFDFRQLLMQTSPSRLISLSPAVAEDLAGYGYSTFGQDPVLILPGVTKVARAEAVAFREGTYTLDVTLIDAKHRRYYGDDPATLIVTPVDW